MRHKYHTRGIVLARHPLGETSAALTLLTPDFGLVRARVQGVRVSGAKLASALATFTESSLVLVRGREGWRISGAVLEENWFQRLRGVSARGRAMRIASLLIRLAAEDARDRDLFPIVAGLLGALLAYPEERHEAVEMLAALRILAALGFDREDIPEKASSFTLPALARAARQRAAYIARINEGIAASGL